MFCLMDVSASMDEDEEGPRQALLRAALPVPHAQVRAGRPRVHPPHRRRRGSRRGHVLPRPALGRHGRVFRARARRQDPQRALRDAAGTSTRRRPPTATRSAPIRRAARASCASSCCRRCATTRTSSSSPDASDPRRRRCGPSTSGWREDDGTFAMRRASRARADLSGVPRAVPQGSARMSMSSNRSRTGADWDFELLEHYDAAIAKVAGRVRARHLRQPDRGHHLRADARRLRVERTAGRLSALVVRQGVHPQRAGVPARHAGARLRDRDQLRSVHRVPDGGEHGDDAGAGHRARLLRPQLVLQGQPSVPAVDRRRRDPRLPRVRAPLRHGMRGAPRRRGGRGDARRLPRADGARRRSLPPPGAADAEGRDGAPRRARGAPRAPVQRPVAHGADDAPRQRRDGRASTFPARAAGEHPLLRREVLAEARAVAARARAHRAQARAVLLSAGARPR